MKKNNIKLSSSFISPWMITGLTDAEGSFIVKLRSVKSNWYVELEYSIELHLRDEEVLNQIKDYFGNTGSIRIRKYRNICVFKVNSLSELLSKVLPHFDSYPLITHKKADYILFKKVVLLMQKREHLTKKGIQEIMNIRAAMNLGLTPTLEKAFPFSEPKVRPIVENQMVPDGYWMSGFTSGDGGFIVNLIPRQNQLKYVQLRFKLTQHSRDDILITSFVSYFECGSTYKDGNCTDFIVANISDINEKIIPFFKKYSILGRKSEDFTDFCRVAEFISDGKHLTESGLFEISKIKHGINRGRK